MKLLPFALIAALILPTAASAQFPTRPDPDSPAGVEYELPLDRARERAAGDDGPGRGGSRGGSRGPAGSAPLFGEGIGPSSGAAGGDGGVTGAGDAGGGGADGGSSGGGGSASSGGGSEGDGGSPSGREPGTEGGGLSNKGASPDVSAATTAAQADKGGSALGPTAAILAGVLIAAGALGLLLRRTMGAR